MNWMPCMYMTSPQKSSPPILILTDSLSVATARIATRHSKHLLIEKSLFNLPPNRFHFQWIPSHILRVSITKRIPKFNVYNQEAQYRSKNIQKSYSNSTKIKLVKNLFQKKPPKSCGLRNIRNSIHHLLIVHNAAFSQEGYADPPPSSLRSSYLYIKDGELTKSNQKSYFSKDAQCSDRSYCFHEFFLCDS